MATFIAVLVGLVLGSFLSVLIARWPAWRGVVAGRSVCPHDHHTLAWYELIPLISWLVQMGRCRVCGKPISVWYPVYEAVMAAALGGYAYLFGAASVSDVLNMLILFCLVSLFFFDVRRFILPDVLTLSLAVLAFLQLLLSLRPLLMQNVLMGAVIAGAFFGLFSYSEGRWLGFGDVKLAAGVGLLFGFPGAITVTMVAIYSGALVGISLMATGKATGGTALPFGAFWTAVSIAAMLSPSGLASVSHVLLPL